ncbi:MAG: multicopper oxidase domain-containing protein [Symploca sp. SIO3E6]|nr:multicopper oxidase domain-containing protein [Caldora sp. SIO3E6]
MGEPIDYFVIADDGLTREQASRTNLTTLQPGYRSDALVVFPEPGLYCVIDEEAPAAGSIGRARTSRRLLAGVYVEPGDNVRRDIGDHVKSKLVQAARNSGLDGFTRERVIQDLRDHLKLSLFTPHPDITNEEIANTKGQELAFFIDTNTSEFGVSNTLGSYFHFQPFDPNRVDRKLKLGDAEEWTLESYLASHPFHIHVNPFQIVKVLNQQGQDVSCKPGEVFNEDGEACFEDPADPQYTGLKGVWKDTIWVKSQSPGSSDGYYKVVVRTRYQRYIGDFVLHCHILDHEDQGMMQKISIVLPENLHE